MVSNFEFSYNRPEPTRGADRIRGEGDGKAGGNRGQQDTSAHKKNGFRNQLSGGSTASPSHTMVGVAGGGGVMAAAGMLKGRVVVALYTYQGSEFGDMTFSKGDQMEIVDDTDPDWYLTLLFYAFIHKPRLYGLEIRSL